jgi:hypothetical protein
LDWDADEFTLPAPWRGILSLCKRAPRIEFSTTTHSHTALSDEDSQFIGQLLKVDEANAFPALSLAAGDWSTHGGTDSGAARKQLEEKGRVCGEINLKRRKKLPILKLLAMARRLSLCV